MKKSIILLTLLSFFRITARDGMWIPSLLKQLNEADLKKMGLEISVDELYGVDKGALNEAVVQFGGGCTGEVVSDKGLVLTNHHCGVSQIQSLSTLNDNYLENGYWAQKQEDELPCPGLTVTFIREIREVTEVFDPFLKSAGSESERNKLVKSLTDSLEKSSSGNGRKAVIKPFFGGNRFFLFATETFRDIRFVGTPPLSVGNFGGETDNWVWPRHTGDFSVFRIYAGADNKPADYSKDNVPYKPARHFKVNTTGVHEGDFTMVYGFPGRTQRYLTSASISLLANQTNPDRIALRDIRMNIIGNAMNVNDTVSLMYSAKFKSLANSYKRWKGELIGLKRDKVLESKKEFESRMNGEALTILQELNKAVEASAHSNYALDYYVEGYSSIEIVAIGSMLKPLLDACESSTSDEKKITEAAAKATQNLKSFYRNYDARVDRKVAEAILALCSEKLGLSVQPDFISDYRKDPAKFLHRLFEKSIFTDSTKSDVFLSAFKPKDRKRLLADPLVAFCRDLMNARTEKIDKPLQVINERISGYQRQWIGYLMSNSKDGMFASDANSTLRLSYGKIESLTPFDGIHYDWQTTGQGLLEKSMQGNPDYAIDAALKALLEKKDFGKYGDNGRLPVAFIASNHTTGGNSGSPVLNAKGELIGINYDRIWEGVMSDLYYDPALSRNIALDIRYVLFIIDRLGRCERLISEMGMD